MLNVAPGTEIPEHELVFTASRSSGPGGQHVNTASTRVTLWFDVPGSTALSEAQKARVLHRLAGRIGRDGRLQVSASSERSQKANLEEARERMAWLLAWALARQRPRRPTAPSRAARERRLAAKKLQAVKKGRRKGPAGEE